MNSEAAAGATPEGLAALERQVAIDLGRLNQPAANWVLPREGPDGSALLDVLVVGGGMCGQTVAQALMREGVGNLRVIDRAPFGAEGPWGTFARMETLRSPKHLTGPDLGVPSLTYRAWHEAQYGADGWVSLHKTDRLDWLRYLLWVRRMTGIPVENDTRLLELSPGDGYATALIDGPAGRERIRAREVVLALGRDGSGAPRWPRWPSFDPVRRHGPVHHSADPIDFAALRGRRIAVLGAGASAFDNAATALEAGAAAAEIFVRRTRLPQVNKSKWTAFPGFLHGFMALDDAQRWRFYTYIFDEQVPPPWESVLRCERHAGFALHLATPWNDVRADADGVTLLTPRGELRFDAAIVATGFDVDLIEREEFAGFRDQVLLWADRIDPQRAAAHPEAARFPYLGPGFELIAKSPTAAPGLDRLRLFSWGSTMSHGAIAGDIPGLAIGAQRLARAVVTRLFTDDAERHWQRLLAHNEEELLPTRWFVPLAERTR